MKAREYVPAVQCHCCMMQLDAFCALFSSCGYSTATLMTRDQTVRQQDRATQHAGPSVEASTDEYPVSYIPALPVPPLSDDSSQLLEIDSDIDDDREEECAISDLEDDYSDHDSSDFENEEQYSSDGDGIYDSEDQHCSCEGCRNVNFF